MPCSKGMKNCYLMCGHRLFVQDYRAERLRQEEAMIESTGGYPEEAADFLRDNPMLTFKDYLIQTKRGEKRWRRSRRGSRSDKRSLESSI